MHRWLYHVINSQQIPKPVALGSTGYSTSSCVLVRCTHGCALIETYILHCATVFRVKSSWYTNSHRVTNATVLSLKVRARHRRRTEHKLGFMDCSWASSRLVIMRSAPSVLMTVNAGGVWRTTVLNRYYCLQSTETKDYIVQEWEITVKILNILPPHWEKNGIWKFDGMHF